MLKCENCGKIFDERELFFKKEPLCQIDGVWQHEEFAVCPHCHSEEVEEAEQCPICGEWEAETEMTYDGVCNTCSKLTREKFNAFLATLTCEEINFLTDAGILGEF